jgi:hypothetical protein
MFHVPQRFYCFVRTLGAHRIGFAKILNEICQGSMIIVVSYAVVDISHPFGDVRVSESFQSIPQQCRGAAFVNAALIQQRTSLLYAITKSSNRI